jgi:hypothetical protein
MSMRYGRISLRGAVALGCIAGASLTVLESRAMAGDNTTTYTPVAEGCSPTHRSYVDTAYGQVYVYVGSHIPAGTKLVAFQYLFDLTDAGNTTGYITPLLFEYKSVEAFTVYTVVGIGKGFEVTLNSAAQTLPFDIIEGTKAPTNGNFTFGFINAMVNSSGVPVETSPGAVDQISPSESGEGVGGTGTTNDWIATVTPGLVVGLGTTFGAGPNADFTFVLPYRTYSARAIGVVAAQ